MLHRRHKNLISSNALSFPKPLRCGNFDGHDDNCWSHMLRVEGSGALVLGAVWVVDGEAVNRGTSLSDSG
jgi:hypothetical protein